MTRACVRCGSIRGPWRTLAAEADDTFAPRQLVCAPACAQVMTDELLAEITWRSGRHTEWPVWVAVQDYADLLAEVNRLRVALDTAACESAALVEEHAPPYGSPVLCDRTSTDEDVQTWPGLDDKPDGASA